jgi:hypothetical protein
MSRINPGAAQLGPREPAHGSINSGIGDEICGVFQLLCDAQRRQYIFSLLRHRLERDHVGGVTTESALVSYNEGSAFSGGHTGDESPAPSWRPVAILRRWACCRPVALVTSLNPGLASARLQRASGIWRAGPEADRPRAHIPVPYGYAEIGSLA